MTHKDRVGDGGIDQSKSGCWIGAGDDEKDLVSQPVRVGGLEQRRGVHRRVPCLPVSSLTELRLYLIAERAWQIGKGGDRVQGLFGDLDEISRFPPRPPQPPRPPASVLRPNHHILMMFAITTTFTRPRPPRVQTRTIQTRFPHRLSYFAPRSTKRTLPTLRLLRRLPGRGRGAQ